MSRHRATLWAFCAGVIAGLAVLVAVLVALLGQRGASEAPGQHEPGRVGRSVVLAVPRGGHVVVDLPGGWGTTRAQPGTLSLASRRTCHTATLSAFMDRSTEPPALRGLHLLGYLSGREFDVQRLWRGTTAGGRGYAVYDPSLLVGVEVVRANPRSTVVVLHGLPTHGRCSRHAAAAPRWELSRLLQDLLVLGRAGLPAHRAAGPTA